MGNYFLDLKSGPPWSQSLGSQMTESHIFLLSTPLGPCGKYIYSKKKLSAISYDPNLIKVQSLLHIPVLGLVIGIVQKLTFYRVREGVKGMREI